MKSDYSLSYCCIFVTDRLMVEIISTMDRLSKWSGIIYILTSIVNKPTSGAMSQGIFVRQNIPWQIATTLGSISLCKRLNLWTALTLV